MASYPILLSLEEGRGRILQRTAPLGRESVSLEEADGRVLAEDVISTEDLPPFPRSPYDGYALRAEDTREASEKQGGDTAYCGRNPCGPRPAKSADSWMRSQDSYRCAHSIRCRCGGEI